MSDDTVRAIAALTAVSCFYAFFYTRVVARWGRFVQPLVRRLGRERSHPVREIDALGKLAAAAGAQALFAAGLLVALGIHPRRIVSMPPITQLLLACALGIAEIAFSSFASALAIKAVLAVDPRGKAAWLGPSRGGWMGLFLASHRVAPPWLFTLCVVIYVSVEEVVFRGLIIETLRPAGALVAIGASVTWFVAAQALHMPSARSALFPMIGGLVIGFVHSIIYWQVPNVVPLALAHAIFFTGALVAHVDRATPPV
ncbi:MAG: CPBP family glutamic-type intramembrane protease [Chthoniobacterales bacterium]